MPPLNTITRDGRVIDARGRFRGSLSRRDLARLHVRARELRLAGLGQFTPSESFGAKVFEFLNPGTVQAEYKAIGKEAPTVADIMTSAASGAVQDVESGAAQLASGFFAFGKWVIVGLVVVGVIVVASRLPRSRRIK